jgi:NAD(P)-dependent dehydrogenase (short-subunit alcohol dehydrogenase family)
LGKAIAQSQLAEGVDVVLAARIAAPLTRIVAEIEQGVNARVYNAAFETRDDRSSLSLIADVLQRRFGLDIVINAGATPASGGAGKTLAAMETADVPTALDTKLLGNARVARAAAPLIAQSGWGRIINIAGLNARTTMNFAAAVRNAGVVALTKCLADELDHTGNNVTAIHAGTGRTARTDGRIAEYANKHRVNLQAAETAKEGHSLIGRMVGAAGIVAIATFLASPFNAAINGEVIAVGGDVRGPLHY